MLAGVAPIVFYFLFHVFPPLGQGFLYWQFFMRRLGYYIQGDRVGLESLEVARAVWDFYYSYFCGQELEGVNYGVRPDYKGFTVYHKISVGNRQQVEDILTVRRKNYLFLPEIKVNRTIPKDQLLPMLRLIRHHAEMAFEAVKPYGTLADFLDMVDVFRASQVLGGFTPPEMMLR